MAFVTLSFVVAACSPGGAPPLTAAPAVLRPATGAAGTAAPGAAVAPPAAPSAPAPTEFGILLERDATPVDPPPAVPSLSDSVRVRSVPRLRDREEVFDVAYPVVDLPDEPARADLDQKMRAVVAGMAYSANGSTHGRCRATLATPELVSVMCDLSIPDARGSKAIRSSRAFTFRLGGVGGAQRVELGAAFLDGARIERGICSKALRRVAARGDACIGVDVALARDHLVGRWHDIAVDRERTIELPYSEIASLVRRDGVLAFAAGEPPETPTPALQAASPQPCRAWGVPAAPSSIGDALLRSGVRGGDFLAIEEGTDLFRLVTPYPDDLRPSEAEALASALGPASAVPCGGRTIAVRTFTAHYMMDLYAAPNGAAARAGSVVDDTPAVRFDRVSGARRDHWWVYVVAADARGWVRETL